MANCDKDGFASRLVGAEGSLRAEDLHIWGNTWRTELYLCPEKLVFRKLSYPLLFALQ